MKRMLLLTLAALIAGGLLFVGPSPAEAKKLYKQEFDAKYVKQGSSDPKDVALREAVEKAGCTVCHVGPKKKTLNPYGLEVQKLLKRKGDASTQQRIQAALDKAAGMKSNPKDAKSPTFGELLTAGKLPAGNAP